MPEGFDEKFVKAAQFVEPSHQARGRRPGPLRRLRDRRAERRRRRAMVKQWRAPEYRERWATVRTVGMVLVLVAFAVGATLWTQRGHGGGPAAAAPVTSGPLPSVVPADPFQGSPASGYADGTTGITVPAVTALGQLSAGQVAAGFETTKRLVEAAGLDRKTLLGGAPDAFAAALSADARSYFVSHLGGGKDSNRSRVASLAPGSATLVGDTIKVHGTMTAVAAARDGWHGMDVKVDYLFVYPIERPGAPSTLQRLVVRLTGTDFFYFSGGTAQTSLRGWGISSTPARCDVHDGFIHPFFADSNPGTVAPSGAASNPYDQSRPVTMDGGCQLSSGT